MLILEYPNKTVLDRGAVRFGGLYILILTTIKNVRWATSVTTVSPELTH
jgi:hypothetical protein